MEKPMKTRYVKTPVLAFAFASSLLGLPAGAQTNPSAGKPNVEAKAEPDAQSIMKFSQDGHAAIVDIEAARLAIFSDEPKTAIKMITKAKASIAKAEREAPPLAGNSSSAPGTPAKTGKLEMIPVDGQLVLADDFVPTPEKQMHIAKANEHFKNGKHKEALGELRLAEIELIYNRLWMPLAPTYKHLDQAIKLIDDHKYYEANLALKAIGDSLTVESLTLTATPKKPQEAPKKAE